MIDTICALATPAGRSALGMIRISGPKASDILRKMTGSDPQVRVAEKKLIRNRAGEALDEAVVVFYKGPNTYTGEDLAEICGHGNPTILQAILDEIVSHETRIAEPGEFTKRALANQKMSLDQVESLNLLMNSNTVLGSKMALKAKLEGLGVAVELLNNELREVLVSIQSQLDFSEEEVGRTNAESVSKDIHKAIMNLEGWVKSFEYHKPLFENWVVALAGPPNSGKSSLFNSLIGFEKAIIYDEPGTTRDPLEYLASFNGAFVVLIDTAGIRTSDNKIEAMGIEKTYEVMSRSDIIVWVSDQAQNPPNSLKDRFKDKKWLFVNSKADLSGPKMAEGMDISVVSGVGMASLKSKICPQIGVNQGFTGAVPTLTSIRQKNHVISAIHRLKSAHRGLLDGEYLDRVAEEVLQASRALEEIIDKIPNESVLKSIFSRFCIGK